MSEPTPAAIHTPNTRIQHSATTLDSEDPEKYIGVDLERNSNSNIDADLLSSDNEINTNPEIEREISRVLTNSQHDAANFDSDKSLNPTVPLLTMGGGRDYPPKIPYERNTFVVSFDSPEDPTHPHNWPIKKKVIQCFTLACFALTMVFGSSIFSASITSLTHVFHVADVVVTLGLSLYVFGFASGPIIWAPLSELFGRKPILLVSCFGFACFNFAVATAENLQTLLICRFFAGFVGAAPLAVIPASFADTFGSKTRGSALLLFSMMIFCGPMLGPIVGTFITDSYLGWRWCNYLIGIMSSACFIGMTVFMDETHHSIILVNKAKALRKQTGNWAIYAPHEEFSLTLQEIVKKNLTRPIYMLFTEPILFMMTLYNGFIYGLLYLLLTAYPEVFVKGYQIKSTGVAQLPFIGVLIGILFGGAFSLYMEYKYTLLLEANGGKPMPEQRLKTMIVGGFIFPIGLFWFTWTGNYHKHVHWIVPTVSGLATGFGLMTIFIPSLNYIVEAYLVFAASAVAGNTLLRSSFGAAFPLFAGFMFDGIGVNWSGLLLGLIAVVLIPVPILFYIYGEKLRAKSKFAFVI